MRLKETSVSSTEEKRVVTGLILSDDVLKRVSEHTQLDYFTNKYLRRVASWCLDFYKQHKRAPNKHISDIYESEAHRLPENETELIHDLLTNLSNMYSGNDINSDFIVDCAEQYYKKRELEITVNNITVHNANGDIDLAEQEMDKYNRVKISIDEGIYINPGDTSQAIELYKKRDEVKEDFFRFNGDVGLFLGNHAKGDVVAITAKQKFGKCNSAKSRVFLSNGLTTTIKEVYENKLTDIICTDKHHHMVKGTVTDWAYTGTKKGYTLTTRTGAVTTSSEEHGYLTPDGWKRLDELKKGDYIAIPTNLPEPSNPTIIDDNAVKVLAYMIADGYLGADMGSIQFTKNDEIVRADFTSSAESIGLQCDNYVDKRGAGRVNLDVRSSSPFFDGYGLLNKRSGDKFIPDAIMKGSNHTVIVFLQHLFCCDGSVFLRKNKGHQCSIQYSTKSRLLIDQIVICLRRFGVVGVVRPKIVKKETYYTLDIHNGKSVKTFSDRVGIAHHKQVLLDEALELIPTLRDYIDVIPHKYNKEIMNELQAQGKEPSYGTLFTTSLRRSTHCSKYAFEETLGADHPLLHTDVIWDRVYSIEYTGMEEMYDLTVAEHHNFIADGIVVHNSFLLNEFCKQTTMQKRHSIKFSIEMTDVEEIERLYKSYFPMINGPAGEYTYPVFDCLKNQTGDCGKRLSKVIVRHEVTEPPEDNPDHVICTKCRDHKDNWRDFTPASYTQVAYREEHNIGTIQRKLKSIKRQLDRYSRVVVRPKYSLTYDLMMRDIENIYHMDGFIPSVIVLDYVDILQIDSKYDDYKLEDEKWKLLQRLAGATKSFVVTATQANKEGILSETLKSTDQAGFYGKSRHVNMMLGGNQSALEKKMGMWRLNVLDARSGFQDDYETCIILQDLKTGQMMLDSYWAGKKYAFN